jgi:hypothetical protein
MTTCKPLDDGSECLQMVLSDGQDEVRVHLHDGDLIGLVVKNAARGLLYEEGVVVGLECEG